MMSLGQVATVPELQERIIGIWEQDPETASASLRRMLDFSHGRAWFAELCSALGWNTSQVIFDFVSPDDWYSLQSTHSESPIANQAEALSGIHRMLLTAQMDERPKPARADTLAETLRQIEEFEDDRLSEFLSCFDAEELGILVSICGPSRLARWSASVPETIRPRVLANSVRSRRIPGETLVAFRDRLDRQYRYFTAVPPPLPTSSVQAAPVREITLENTREKEILSFLRAESPEILSILADFDYEFPVSEDPLPPTFPLAGPGQA